MRLLVVAWREAPVAVALAAAGRRIGLETRSADASGGRAAGGARRPRPLLSRREAVARRRRSRAWPSSEDCGRAGVTVLNGPEAIARLPRQARDRAAPRPRRPAAPRDRVPERVLEPPRRLTPSLPGRWSSRASGAAASTSLAATSRTRSASLLGRLRKLGWFRRHGALIQELRPAGRTRPPHPRRRRPGRRRRPPGRPPGEWRTNVALGAVRRPVQPQPRECELAVAAAAGRGRRPRRGRPHPPTRREPRRPGGERRP